MHDACGLSGAYDVGPGVSGYEPLFPGSNIPAQLNTTSWPAGGVAEVGWSLWSNHGGGYTYRLCSKVGASVCVVISVHLLVTRVLHRV
jgi:hypothetical protein